MRYRALFDYAPDGIVIADRESRYIDANASICRMLGYAKNELIGLHASDIVVPAEVQHIDAALAAITESTGYHREWEFRRKDGSSFRADVMATAMPDGNLLAMIRDLTERHLADEALRDTEERLQAQVQQAQKMDAVGRLAGGIAHDFNNLLTVILGFCELLLMAEGDGNAKQRQADVEEIQQAARRAAELTHQLLAFSRKEIIEPKLLDLNVVIADLQPMLGRLIREDVKMIVGARSTAYFKGDKGQVEQVVLNLVVNAQDAMPKGGTLTIESADVELDEHYAAMHIGVTPGRYVVLTVTDSGVGMTADVMAHLFEPFFTTKEVGKGTGLGLATVHGIVTRGGGSVNVYSEVGQGTSIKVYFPQSTDEEPLEMTVKRGPLPFGDETILVVEDAEGLRELTKRLLERLGYTVIVAANGDEAIRRFDDNSSIRLILTDVVMPGLSGPDLVKELIKRRPGLKVVYMSGYTDDAIVEHGMLLPGIAFMHKPFTAEALGAKIRDVLDGLKMSATPS